MPLLDRTGPRGFGPGTGRQLGPCLGAYRDRYGSRGGSPKMTRRPAPIQAIGIYEVNDEDGKAYTASTDREVELIDKIKILVGDSTEFTVNQTTADLVNQILGTQYSIEDIAKSLESIVFVLQNKRRELKQEADKQAVLQAGITSALKPWLVGGVLLLAYLAFRKR